MADDDILVIEPGDERAQKIGKAMASQTANDILQLLADEPKTATDLTEALHIPMSTIKYHLDNLLAAGLLEVKQTKYSVKGREIKVYGVRNQLVIVAPKMINIRSILLKYASLFCLVILASLVMFAILPLFQPMAVMAPPPAMKSDGGAGAICETSGMFTQQPSEITGTPLPTAGEIVQRTMPEYDLYAPGAAPPDYVPILAFFGGGCLVLLLLFLYEAYLWQKDRAGNKKNGRVP